MKCIPRFLFLCSLMAAVMLTASCKKSPSANTDVQMKVTDGAVVERPSRGIYFWKTTFLLTPSDRKFLHQHDLHAIYLRLFDVAYEYDNDGCTKAVPIATTAFPEADSSYLDGIEIIPVVYITNEAIQHDTTFTEPLYERVKAMAKRNHLGTIREIQLDCDWTTTSRSNFYAVCERLCKLAHNDKMIVSATLRLHQLRQELPPVDRGALMLYNVGSLYDSDAENTILNIKDVEAYLMDQHIEVMMPLSCIFPTFSWAIHLRNNRFQRIIRTTDFSDSHNYQSIGRNRFRVLKTHYLEGAWMIPGDIVRLEQPSTENILETKRLVHRAIRMAIDSHQIYHLDALNLSRYTYETIDNILAKP